MHQRDIDLSWLCDDDLRALQLRVTEELARRRRAPKAWVVKFWAPGEAPRYAAILEAKFPRRMAVEAARWWVPEGYTFEVSLEPVAKGVRPEAVLYSS